MKPDSANFSREKGVWRTLESANKLENCSNKRLSTREWSVKAFAAGALQHFEGWYGAFG